MNEQTITINGTVYDAVTGMPIRDDAPVEPAREVIRESAHASHEVHRTQERSHTLNRQTVKQHAPAIGPRRITRSPAISKFAPHPTGSPVQSNKIVSDIGPVRHPLVEKAQAAQKARATSQLQPVQHVAAVSAPTLHAPKPSQIIKNEAIAKALDEAPSHHHRSATKQVKTPRHKHARHFSIAAASVALLLLGGYFTYLNMPSISVRVAAAQAGVNASYPDYHPDGYSISGPVAYTSGQVRMKFAANGGGNSFTIAQTKTNWDSTAAKANYADDKWGSENIDTYNVNGLTVYAHDGDAVWVNDGILYTISGNAPLSADQLRHLAASL